MDKIVSMTLLVTWFALLVPSLIDLNREIAAGFYVWQAFFFIVTPILLSIPAVEFVFWACEKVRVPYYDIPLISIVAIPIVITASAIGFVVYMIHLGVIA